MFCHTLIKDSKYEIFVGALMMLMQQRFKFLILLTYVTLLDFS